MLLFLNWYVIFLYSFDKTDEYTRGKQKRGYIMGKECMQCCCTKSNSKTFNSCTPFSVMDLFICDTFVYAIDVYQVEHRWANIQRNHNLVRFHAG